MGGHRFMNTIRPVIMGIAKGHSADELRPFIVSLRRTGYAGDICLFVDKLTPEAVALLHEHRVSLHAFPDRYFIRERRHLLRWLTRLLPAKSRTDAQVTLSQYYLHLIDARWPAYSTFLKATRGLYTHVMFTDVKDVLFQRSPFDFNWKGSFCSFCEPPGFYIKDEGHTQGWIREGFGEAVARELGEKRVICAGVSFAEIDAAHEYLALMCENLIRINARGLVDQGVHNYLLHRGLLKSFHVYEYEETPVVHLGLMPPDKLQLNDEGLVVNGTGRVVNTIHQYFPHRPALARCLATITTPMT
jgi:hypothetical protein